jgi:hypothetical protein
MDHAHRVEVPLEHPLEVTEVLHYLQQELGCQSWYVACHHDHLFVFRLTKESRDRYAVSVECSGPTEKGVYHGSKTRSLSISPLHDASSLEPEDVKRLEAGLANLS